MTRGVAAFGAAAMVAASLMSGGVVGTATIPPSSAAGLVVSVAYAEDIGNVPAVPQWFPIPWSGAPNTIFIGGPNPQTAECGSVPPALCYDAAAIRLDNRTSADIVVDGVAVDVHSRAPGGKLYDNLWGAFTVPAGKSVILTENPPPPARSSSYDNFDSSDTPHASCTPISTPPTVRITVNGVATMLTDTQHVLDTGATVRGVFGGVDSGWCPTHQNESVQWQEIGAATRTLAATLTVTPSSRTVRPGRRPVQTATLVGGDGIGLPNASVTFTVTAGPNAGTTSGPVFTDATGTASWSYADAGSQKGADTITASAGTDGTFQSKPACVVWGSGACPEPPGCPSPWTCADVGSPGLAGASTLFGGVWTLNGGGNDIEGSADQFQFVSEPLAADGSISAHVTSQSNTSSWAKTGVMMRLAAAAGSPNYALLVTPGNGIVVSYRATEGGSTTVHHSLPSGGVPTYLRVARSGSVFTSYTSADGAAWAVVPGSTTTLSAMSGAVMEGLADTSHNSSALCEVTMDTVQTA